MTTKELKRFLNTHRYAKDKHRDAYYFPAKSGNTVTIACELFTYLDGVDIEKIIKEKGG